MSGRATGRAAARHYLIAGVYGGMEYFPDMVAYMDILIGRLMTGLKDLGLREDTLILFYSDNGTDKRISPRVLRNTPAPILSCSEPVLA